MRTSVYFKLVSGVLIGLSLFLFCSYLFLKREKLFPLSEGTLFWEIQYYGKGEKLSRLALLGENFCTEDSSEPLQYFFGTLQRICRSSQADKNSPFFLQAIIIWDKKYQSWKTAIFSTRNFKENMSLGQGKNVERAPLPKHFSSREDLLFSTSFSRKDTESFTQRARENMLLCSEKAKDFSLTWSFSDGGMLEEKWPHIFAEILLIQGDIYFKGGKGFFSWEIDDFRNLFAGNFFDKAKILQRAESEMYLPSFLPAPLIAEAGGNDLGLFTLFLQKNLLSGMKEGERALLPKSWFQLAKKALSYFFGETVPFTIVLGGESRIFTVSFPGILVRFPQKNYAGCPKVERFWKRFHFILSSPEKLENFLCGGFSSLPATTLMVAGEKEMLGGFITKESFRLSQNRKSLYTVFFGRSLFLGWIILDFSALHVSIEQTLLEGRVLAKIPFDLLAKINFLKNYCKKISFLGVLGCGISENGKGTLVISSDIFN
ncbi:MAG TPA: hypothetical protein PK364_02715 [Synergistaceae bacterium]|nr:hypothetical protein [Synergistaceae bacterium]HPJ24814.1 hypothetical protein [Synergistaceae bacterium]HPQ36253.1 hypothetical protein [Synergistaceae bacterium]